MCIIAIAGYYLWTPTRCIAVKENSREFLGLRYLTYCYYFVDRRPVCLALCRFRLSAFKLEFHVVQRCPPICKLLKQVEKILHPSLFPDRLPTFHLQREDHDLSTMHSTINTENHYIRFSIVPATKEELTLRKAFTDALLQSFGATSSTFLDLLWLSDEGTECVVRVHKE